jgi:DNA-binding transcriptional LysR family regulator
MDLRQLEILRAVAEKGSFTGAGRHLHLSQSAVSRQILLLEDELHEPLFLRIGRKVRITPAGEQLLQLSYRIFKDMEETCSSIREGQDALSGTLRLMGGMTVCLYVFPALIKEYRRLHPGIEVKVTPGTATRLLRKFRSGAADLALLTLPLDDPNLVTVPVMREELMLVTAPGHSLASRRRVTPQDLVRQPFILFEAGSNTRRVLDDFFLREAIEPRIVSETENVEIIKAMVRVGLGVSIIPYHSVAREVRAGHLACARMAGPALVRETGWVYPRSHRVPRMVQEMIQTLDKLLPRLRLSPRGTPPSSQPKVVPLQYSSSS